jgi:hypothetical protein
MAIEFRPHGTFVATDFVQNRYVVEVLREVIEHPINCSWSRTLLLTSDRLLVRRIARGLYELVGSGRMLQSDDPACF